MARTTKQYNHRHSSVEIQKAIWEIFKDVGSTMTVRQVYYALTVKGVVPKTENGYRKTVYQLKILRELRVLPYTCIADNTRWFIKPETSSDVCSAVARMAENYRRDMWLAQPEYVELWVEKDALAGVMAEITRLYDVPLYIARGYSSLTACHGAAELIKEKHKPAFIYHFGDYDPSGVDAAYNISKGLREHGADITFRRVAISPGQIEQFNLPNRPTKKSDPRAKAWGNQPSVELDALPVPILKEFVRQVIERHIDQKLWNQQLLLQEHDRVVLTDISNNLVLGQNS